MKQFLFRHNLFIRSIVVSLLSMACVWLAFWLFDRSLFTGMVAATYLMMGTFGLLVLYWVSR